MKISNSFLHWWFPLKGYDFCLSIVLNTNTCVKFALHIKMHTGASVHFGCCFETGFELLILFYLPSMGLCTIPGHLEKQKITLLILVVFVLCEKSYTLHFFIVCVSVCTCEYMCVHACVPMYISTLTLPTHVWGQKTVCVSQVCMWVLGIKFKFSGLIATSFTHGVI